MPARVPFSSGVLSPALLLVVMLVGGCHLLFPFSVDKPARNDAGVDAPPADAFVAPDGSVTRTYHFPATPLQRVDILFVVDNSNSMQEEQQALALTFPKFVDALAQSTGGLPDLQIGVVSTDLGAGGYSMPSCEVVDGDDGKLQSKPGVAGCDPPGGLFISHKAGVTNVPGAGSAVQKVKDAFGCIAQLGVGGCGFEQPIEAARRATDPALDRNPGFIRDDALLVVVFVTDEDDCSVARLELFDPAQLTKLGPLTSYRCFRFGVQCSCPKGACTPSTLGPRTDCKPALDWLQSIPGYVGFFSGLKPKGRVVLAALAGPSTPVAVKLDGADPAVAPSCQRTPGNSAAPGIRLQALLDGFGTAALFESICSDDFGVPLRKLGTLIASQLGGACLRPLVDTNPGASGLQASCKVDDVVGASIKPVPPCKDAGTQCKPCPCWRVEADASCGPLGGHRLVVARDGPAASGTVLQARCLSTPWSP